MCIGKFVDGIVPIGQTKETDWSDYKIRDIFIEDFAGYNEHEVAMSNLFRGFFCDNKIMKYALINAAQRGHKNLGEIGVIINEPTDNYPLKTITLMLKPLHLLIPISENVDEAIIRLIGHQ